MNIIKFSTILLTISHAILNQTLHPYSYNDNHVMIVTIISFQFMMAQIIFIFTTK